MCTRHLHLQVDLYGVLAFAAFSAVGGDAPQLEEAIITAERRAQSLQDATFHYRVRR
jgi:outer membrane cobalamin receptor